AEGLRVRYPYFPHEEPVVIERASSYADPEVPVEETEYGWDHSMAELVNAVAGAGLRIEALTEYDYCGWKQLPVMVSDQPGHWRLPEGQPRLPWMFSLKATKPAA